MATDDKTPICLPFLLSHLRAHQRRHTRPLFVGLNGLQGIGKTTLVSRLASALRAAGVPALVCSIDDFYLPRAEQAALAARHPDNALWQHRGEPGTHDLPLATAVLAALRDRAPCRLPRYDKAAAAGRGDRLPPADWPVVPADPPCQLVILEGWCVGFRALGPSRLAARYAAPSRTLRAHALDHLRLVDDALRAYDALTDFFDAFVHIDADDLLHVYRWRREQEHDLRRQRGDPAAGMSDEQVDAFVDGYFPAYELYCDGLRQGVLPDRPGSQLRIVVDGERRVKQVFEIGSTTLVASDQT